jgi:hypothetical protein
MSEVERVGDFGHQGADLIRCGAGGFVFDDALAHGHCVLVGDPIVKHGGRRLQLVAVFEHLACLRFDLAGWGRWRPADDHQCLCLREKANNYEATRGLASAMHEHDAVWIIVIGNEVVALESLEFIIAAPHWNPSTPDPEINMTPKQVSCGIYGSRIRQGDSLH